LKKAILNYWGPCLKIAESKDFDNWCIDFTKLKKGTEVVATTCGGDYSLTVVDSKSCAIDFKGSLLEKDPPDLVELFKNSVHMKFSGSTITRDSSGLIVNRMVKNMCMELDFEYKNKSYVIRSAPVTKAVVKGEKYQFQTWPREL